MGRFAAPTPCGPCPHAKSHRKCAWLQLRFFLINHGRTRPSPPPPLQCILYRFSKHPCNPLAVCGLQVRLVRTHGFVSGEMAAAAAAAASTYESDFGLEEEDDYYDPGAAVPWL